MTGKSRKFILLAFAATLLAQVFLPLFSHDTYAATYSKISASTASAVDKVLYMAAMELCLQDQYSTDGAIKNNIAVGDNLATILTYPSREVYVGPIVSNSKTSATSSGNGYIKCQDALNGLVGNKTITEDMLGSSTTDILSNVYSKTSLQEKTLECGYYILNWGNKGDSTDVYRNSDGTPRKFFWPQGYIGADGGSNKPGEDKTSAQKITILFNDDGFVGLEPKNDQIASQFTSDWGDSVSQDILRGNDPGQWCGYIIKEVGAYNLQSYNSGHQDAIDVWYGDTIHWTDDNAPFNEGGGINIKDGHAAWLKHDSNNPGTSGERQGYTYSVNTRETNIQYTRNSGAAQTLLGNLRELFFTSLPGVASQVRDIRGYSAMSYMDKKDGLAYLFYGRYLFNGDGKMPYNANNGGCGAQTVLNDDKVSLLPQDKWNYTLPYAAYTYAYGSSSKTSKTTYLSSWAGANNNKKTEISITPGDSFGMYKIDCEDIATKFNAATTINASAKTKVLGYMNVAKVNDDGSITMPDGTIIQEPGTPPADTGGDTGGDTTPTKPTCFDGGGALGWIVCPVLEGLGSAAKKMYEEVITPFLRVDARLFSGDGAAQGTRLAWGMFQGIANIAFIILLLVVIFSQVTGVGIDNYGIKKILPKLIIAAILINLSYIVCQLAVDISNIIGFGINDIFSNLASGIQPKGAVFEGAGADTANTVITIISFFALAGGAVALFSAGLALILPLLMGILSAVIAILFVFILLGVRQAGVVLLVVIAPVAIVCYILPNTKKLFDRWLKMLTGLLILFPLCGLLIGGAGLASRILLSTGTPGDENFWLSLIALLINVVPFFFLPMLLKSSFAAMGNIGAKISGFGAGLNKRAVGAAKPALEKSRFGQFATRGRNARQWNRNQINTQRTKARMDEEKQVMQGAYTGSDPLKRMRSRVNEQRASSRIPGWGTNDAAFSRDKRFRHMGANGQYDGSVSRVNENMQLQGMLAGDVFQGDYDANSRTSRGVERRNRFEAHSGGMTSNASKQTFDKYTASANSNDIANMGANYGNMRRAYDNMSRATGTVDERAEILYNEMFEQYRNTYGGANASADDLAEAHRQTQRQLGMRRNEQTGALSGYNEMSLHQIQDEAARRASEMNKRQTAANQEATIAAIGGNATNQNNQNQAGNNGGGGNQGGGGGGQNA